jgi:hypothetical protein
MISEHPSVKLTIPDFLSATQTETSQFLFVNVENMNGSLYISVFEDFAQPTDHAFAWFGTDDGPDTFRDMRPGAVPELSGGITILLVTALLIAIVAVLISVHYLRPRKFELPEPDAPDDRERPEFVG